MRFLLLGRTRDTVVLLTSTLYESRSDALEEVARLAAAGPETMPEAILIADLDAAAPVLVVQQPAKFRIPVAEPASVVPPVEPTASAAADDASVWEAPSIAESDFVPEADVEPADTVEQFDPLKLAEPIEPVEPILAEPVEAESGEEPDLPTSEPAEAESASLPAWPWEVQAPSAQEDTLQATEEPSAEEAMAPAEEDEPVAEVEVASPQSTGVEVVSEERISDLLDDLEETPAEPIFEAPAPVYEAGNLDLSALTCDECIYLNTCPKRGDSTPENCGSFQWRVV